MSPVMRALMARTYEFLLADGEPSAMTSYEPFLCVIDGRLPMSAPQFALFARQALAA